MADGSMTWTEVAGRLALVACAGVTLRAVATSLQIDAAGDRHGRAGGLGRAGHGDYLTGHQATSRRMVVRLAATSSAMA
jgi:hypothetical protein